VVNPSLLFVIYKYVLYFCSIWLDAILPLVVDRETTAQEKCLSVLEEIILHHIALERGTQNEDQVLAWKLLQLIAGISGQELR
jgi:hypothetical protein